MLGGHALLLTLAQTGGGSLGGLAGGHQRGLGSLTRRHSGGQRLRQGLVVEGVELGLHSCKLFGDLLRAARVGGERVAQVGAASLQRLHAKAGLLRTALGVAARLAGSLGSLAGVGVSSLAIGPQRLEGSGLAGQARHLGTGGEQRVGVAGLLATQAGDVGIECGTALGSLRLDLAAAGLGHLELLQFAARLLDRRLQRGEARLLVALASLQSLELGLQRRAGVGQAGGLRLRRGQIGLHREFTTATADQQSVAPQQHALGADDVLALGEMGAGAERGGQRIGSEDTGEQAAHGGGEQWVDVFDEV